MILKGFVGELKVLSFQKRVVLGTHSDRTITLLQFYMESKRFPQKDKEPLRVLIIFKSIHFFQEKKYSSVVL